MDLGDVSDPFAVPHLWKKSLFSTLASEPGSAEQQPDAPLHLDGSGSLFPPVQLDVENIQLSNPFAPKASLEHDLRLPDLETFAFGPLEDLEISDASVASTAGDERVPDDASKGLDPWEANLGIGPLKGEIRFHTWEAFEDRVHREPCSAYLSEAGAGAFDAAVAGWEGRRRKGKSREQECLRQSDTLLKSLFLLGLGHRSVVFPGGPLTAATKDDALERCRISGVSSPVSDGVKEKFRRVGCAFAKLQQFTDGVFGDSHTYPARAGLAGTVTAMLSTVEGHLGDNVAHVRSLLQLQALFAPVESVISALENIVLVANRATSDAQLLDALCRHFEDIEYQAPELRDIFLEIIAQVANPWLATVGEWTGLSNSNAAYRKGKIEDELGFLTPVATNEGEQSTNSPSDGHGYECDPDGSPSHLSEKDREEMLEIGHSFRLLKATDPTHPLVSASRSGVQPPKLELCFDWQGLADVESMAGVYEEHMMAAIDNASKGSDNATVETHDSMEEEPRDVFTNTPEELATYLSRTTDAFQSPLSLQTSPVYEPLKALTLAALSRTSDSAIPSLTIHPPFPIALSLSLSPLLRAQSRLLARATTALLLHTHDLRRHLTLHAHFHLLTNGPFVRRLTDALLDPTASSVERKRNVLRTGERFGLQLGKRETWPPASSELRLALAGILQESYEETFLSSNINGPSTSSTSRPFSQPDTESSTLSNAPSFLPGALSFSIRHLPSSHHISQVLDPTSLQALDFLRLSYTPTSPLLAAVITPAALEKLDSIFKFLLRLLRVRWAAEQNLARALVSSRHRNRRSARQRKTEASQSQAEIAAAAAAKARHALRITTTRFVQACAAHFAQSGVGEPWAALERALDALNSSSSSSVTPTPDPIGKASSHTDANTGSDVPGLSALRTALSTTLDTISWRLFLRKRQAPILNVLEGALGLVLRFLALESRLSSSDGDDSRTEDGEEEATGAEAKGEEVLREVGELKAEFEEKVNLLRAVLRGLRGKRGYVYPTSVSSTSSSSSSSSKSFSVGSLMSGGAGMDMNNSMGMRTTADARGDESVERLLVAIGD